MIYLVPTNENSPTRRPISFFWRNLIEQKKITSTNNVFHKLTATHKNCCKCVYTIVYNSGQETTRCNAQHVNTLVYIESEMSVLSPINRQKH